MRRLKVLHVIKSLGRGGAEMLLPETLALHNQQQFEFKYIYFLPWKDQLVQRIMDEGAEVKCLDASNNLVIMLKTLAVIKYAKQHRIDIIHCHLPWAGFVGRLVHVFSGIPILYSEHNKQERYHWLTAFLNKFTFNWQNEVISVSDDVKSSILSNIKPKIPVRTILNGVNTNRFSKEKIDSSKIRKELGLANDIAIVGNVCVFRTQKRLDVWLDEAAKIRESLPGTHFVLIGDGPKQEMVENKINQLGLRANIHLPGRLDEVRPWLSAMDVFMISSEFEGLPIALLEAMSMEVPVVTTDAGGIKEVIRHKHNGWMVGLDETHLLSDGAIALLKDTELKNKLASNARSTVIKKFSLQRMVSELEDTYESLNLTK